MTMMYKLIFKLHQSNPIYFKWITYVKSIFDECGLSFIWNDQIDKNRNVLKSVEFFYNLANAFFSMPCLFSNPHTSQE
jgi:hypothetical protein